MQCEHLIVMTAVLHSGDYCSMKVEQEARTWRRKVVHVHSTHCVIPQKSAVLIYFTAKPEITRGSTCVTRLSMEKAVVTT